MTLAIIINFLKKYGYVFAVIFFILFISTSIARCSDSIEYEKQLKREVERIELEKKKQIEIELAEHDKIMSEKHKKEAEKYKSIIDSISKIKPIHKWKKYTRSEIQIFFDTTTNLIKPIQW